MLLGAMFLGVVSSEGVVQTQIFFAQLASLTMYEEKQEFC